MAPDKTNNLTCVDESEKALEELESGKSARCRCLPGQIANTQSDGGGDFGGAETNLTCGDDGNITNAGGVDLPFCVDSDVECDNGSVPDAPERHDAKVNPDDRDRKVNARSLTYWCKSYPSTGAATVACRPTDKDAAEWRLEEDAYSPCCEDASDPSASGLALPAGGRHACMNAAGGTADCGCAPGYVTVEDEDDDTSSFTGPVSVRPCDGGDGTFKKVAPDPGNPDGWPKCAPTKAKCGDFPEEVAGYSLHPKVQKPKGGGGGASSFESPTYKCGDATASASASADPITLFCGPDTVSKGGGTTSCGPKGDQACDFTLEWRPKGGAGALVAKCPGKKQGRRKKRSSSMREQGDQHSCCCCVELAAAVTANLLSLACCCCWCGGLLFCE